MIKGIVLDRNDNFIEELIGNYSASRFTYWNDAKWFLGIRIGGTEDHAEFDYSLMVPTVRYNFFGMAISERKAYYRWDGTSLTQIAFTMPKESSTTVDYEKNFKLGEAVKALILKDPAKGNESLLTWLAIIVVGIMIIAAWVSGNSVVTNLQKATAPFGKTANATVQIEAYIANNIRVQSERDNLTLAYMENLTRYLEANRPISGGG
jgi:hypothetical protein